MEELKYVCLALDVLCDELNPNNVTYCPTAYLEEIKNYYIQNHNGWIFVIWSFWEGLLYSRITYKKVTNAICGQLISWSPNCAHYQCQYDYATKWQFVCRWKWTHGFAASAKKREAICDNKLVNFFKDMEHKNCICSKV